MYQDFSVKREEGQSLTERDHFLLNLASTLSLLVSPTDNPNRKFMIACRKEDSVSKPQKYFYFPEKVCKIAANAYYTTFLAGYTSDEDEDPYYDKTPNDTVKVESLTCQGYILPHYHVELIPFFTV